jgi:photosystem II stability/assembly factor-like uncharacterized protein
MVKNRPFVAFLIVIALNFIVDESFAQWKQIASEMIVGSYAGGTMHFKDGILYAGRENGLYISPDSGQTWTKQLASHEMPIRAIHFYDKNIGIVAMGYGLHITADGGNTWKELLLASNTIASAFFGDSPNTIYVLQEYSPPMFYVTHDGGKIWNKTNLEQTSNVAVTETMAVAKNNTIYIAAGFREPNGDIVGGVLSSTDEGSTWIRRKGITDLDCWTILTDSCNSDRLYLLNENSAIAGDGFSKILVSSDGGDSWQTTFSRPIRYLTGALTSSRNALYANTYNGSIVRSTDRGMTWKELPAPTSQIQDCGVLICASDNVVFLMANSRSIWRTDNSAGDSLLDFSAPLYISATSANLSIDTIGGEAGVPISITGLEGISDIELILRYDKDLTYKGSYSLDNVPLDVPGESWPGRAKLRINRAKGGAILGYARFDVFPITGIDTFRVTFDSLNILSSGITCQYILTVPTASTITPSPGCAARLISRFMTTGQMPQLSIVPNPTSGNFSIASSHDLGIMKIEIFDMLGMRQTETFVTLSKAFPANVSMLPVDGVYNIRISNDILSANMRVVVRH